MNRRIGECLDSLDAAQALGYNRDECDGCRWQCWMLLGEFEKAWRASEGLSAPSRPDANRLWDGAPFTGKRVMIRCLHGLGDAIQFIRYAALVRKCSLSVTVESHGGLVNLFQQQSYIDHAITWENPAINNMPEWDQQIEVMELPRAFRTTLATIPSGGPYLSRRSRVRPTASKRRVGILWESGGWDRSRDIPLIDLRPLLKLRHRAEFYNFQRGLGRAALFSLDEGRDIVDLSGDSSNVCQFADDLMDVDLLITVDTMAAHLAGALGRPVWVLLPYCADWRWMLQRSDSPWYPTMRLFRQRTPGDWGAPVTQLADELSEFIHPGSRISDSGIEVDDRSRPLAH